MAGYRIGPLEVEKVILSHPVAECAVVATPDEVRGEVIEAVVVLRRDRTPTPELTAEIKACGKTGFAAHAYQRRVHYVSDMPKTQSGKIHRFEVRDNPHKVARGRSVKVKFVCAVTDGKSIGEGI